jgi:hypothetical protein
VEKIDFDVSGQRGRTGFCNVTFSTQLMEQSYTILLDGSPTIPVEKTNSARVSVYFTYSQNTQHIEVTETTPVPEFPSITAFLAVLSILSVSYLFLRRSRSVSLEAHHLDLAMS